MKKKTKEHLVGIPTQRGIEIVPVSEIIRCEGMQKCTRIISSEKKDIVSSYSIGVFRKLLQEFGSFFSPHRSYVVNMNFICKYERAGHIVMKDGSRVPVTRTRRNDFLELITVMR